ncbi:MAG: hypothetical protein AAFQ13_05500 [Pseudomonadota bacterium]
MTRSALLLGAGAALCASAGSPAAAEPYDAYLERLKDVCSVECLKPRDFRRAARKQSPKDESDMAVMMDVRAVRRDGDKYHLLSQDLSLSNLETLAILGGAGIDTSGRTGVGGLPQGGQAPTSPDLIIIELDAQTVADLLRVPVGSATPRPLFDANGDIIVESDVENKRRKPTEAGLSNTFINRRIVVRGSTRLEPTWVGGRRDFRRKQVSLVVDNADDLVLLPRYDEDGNPILDGTLAGLASSTTP